MKDNFLPSAQCDELVKNHQNRLKELMAHEPVICFTDESALKSHMVKSSANWAEKITATDFVKGKI